jgi:uncharacterized protein (DUF1697 family)
MTTYISIVRGINVGGHKLIKMNALKQLFTNLGFQNIHTYIQSGNIVFQNKKADQQKLEKKIEKAIADTFSFDVPVLVKEYDELKKIVLDNPFITDTTKDISHLHITFLSTKPHQESINKIKTIQFNADEFHLVDKAIYLYCPNGYSNSKLTNSFIESKLKVTATTRNWKTTNELVNIAEKINKS